ncbi:hypothetical protein Sjap_025933 [Stephania japonica]|uniref:Uncharacterized protein n=1 Tax=Stephania japonica TaxID=461633 RepID=A0AAP0E632_9MAGN
MEIFDCRDKCLLYLVLVNNEMQQPHPMSGIEYRMPLSKQQQVLSMVCSSLWNNQEDLDRFYNHGWTKWYRHYKPCGNPLTRIAQVFVAAGKKRKVSVPADGDELYELEDSESAIKGSRKIYHSDNFRVLDKAATLTEKEMTDPSRQNTWKLHQAAFFHLDWTATPPSQGINIKRL